MTEPSEPSHGEKVILATKAAFPELWGDEINGVPEAELSDEARVALTMVRQTSTDRVIAALEAYGKLPAGGDATQSVTLVLPDRAAMLQQSLAITTFLDREGSLAYSVQMLGSGSEISWLGMAESAKLHVIRSFDNYNPEEG